MEGKVSLSPDSLLAKICASEVSGGNKAWQDYLALATANGELKTIDYDIAVRLAIAVEMLHKEIWPKDKCQVSFSSRDDTRIGQLNDLMYQSVEYRIFVRGIAKKIARIRAIDLMRLDLEKPDRLPMAEDWRKADESSAILMAAVGLLRQCYREENHNDQFADFRLVSGPLENLGKVNDPWFKIVADYMIKVSLESDWRSDFDLSLIIYWIGVLCQKPLGLSVADLKRAITLSPKDVGIL